MIEGNFVTEADVREASSAGKKIAINSGTKITSLARELGEKLEIFIQSDK